MTSPVIMTRAHYEGARHGTGETVRRPDWSSPDRGHRSNTSVAGVAFRPGPSARRARQSIVQSRVPDRERAFDPAGRWARILRRGRLVLQSPGVALLSGVTSVLLMGLSPILADDTASDPNPAAPVVVSVPDSGSADRPGIR